ncbi:hypothetical protein PIN31009_03497 [Pandoraea iniqua]|uniref:hypothetical protein n=1 Tax=Pandoraea iniqua TaxID=2508288 RepID=UPI0012429900|nr:hypothetical protein [Pandoraea iniqua]VVE28535.1 hypothetical protein PIN31009_03497 [Pandoraea iniqua]
MIVILSNKWDITVDFVVRELKARHAEFIRINTEELLRDGVTVRMPGPRLVVGKGAKTVDLSSRVTAIWCRRPGKPYDFVPKEQKPSEAIQKFVSDQWYSCLESLELLPNVRWVNPPARSSQMESKLHQLQLAAELGFNVPRTLISNIGDEIRDFCEAEGGRLVVKSLYAPLIEEPEQDFFVFSNVITAEDLHDDKSLSIAPCIFQQAIWPKIDYRVTVIGDTVFTVRIGQSDGEHEEAVLDWRTREANVSLEACDLPESIEHLCREFVFRAGLTFGAIDLVEHAGQFYFLEINPNGEWGWLEKTARVPISSALCDTLLNGTKQ